MLYNCTKFCESISQGYRVTDPNSTADARVVANVDGWMNIRKTLSLHRALYRAMPETGAAKVQLFGTCC